MKRFVVAIFAISCSIFITNAFPNREHEPGHRPPPHSWNGCQPPDCNGTSCSAAAIPGQGVTHVGTPYDPSPILGLPDDEDEPGNVPNANPQGPFIPSGPAINLTQIDGNAARVKAKGRRQSCGGGSIFFDTSTVFSNSATQPPEPSGARAGNIIFTTANPLAAVSLDGGLTFQTIDPSVYSGPNFCCDQVVQYLPSIDRFAWVIQYRDDATSSRNKLRVITFHPRDVTATRINSWLYADFNEERLERRYRRPRPTRPRDWWAVFLPVREPRRSGCPTASYCRLRCRRYIHLQLHQRQRRNPRRPLLPHPKPRRHGLLGRPFNIRHQHANFPVARVRG